MSGDENMIVLLLKIFIKRVMLLKLVSGGRGGNDPEQSNFLLSSLKLKARHKLETP